MMPQYNDKNYFPKESMEKEKANALKKARSIEKNKYDKSYPSDDDNIVFEDFAKLRLNEPDE